MHCVHLALWTHRVLCGSFYAPHLISSCRGSVEPHIKDHPEGMSAPLLKTTFSETCPLIHIKDHPEGTSAPLLKTTFSETCPLIHMKDHHEGMSAPLLKTTFSETCTLIHMKDHPEGTSAPLLKTTFSETCPFIFQCKFIPHKGLLLILRPPFLNLSLHISV